MLCYPSPESADVHDDAGLRIEHGQIEIVTRTVRYPDPLAPLPVTTDRITTSRQYDPQAMRWLWIWERHFSWENQGPEAWYAPTVDGPWTRLGGIGGFNEGAKVWLALGATGDGSSSEHITVGA